LKRSYEFFYLESIKVSVYADSKRDATKKIAKIIRPECMGLLSLDRVKIDYIELCDMGVDV
jgi:hypothetical protein